MCPAVHRSFLRRTVVRDLTIGIVVTIITVTLTISLLNYLLSVAQTERRLSQQANDVVTKLSSVLALPLWNLDADGVRLVAQAYQQTENLVSLVISNDLGEVLYERRASPGEEVVTVERPIEYLDRPVGFVEVALTTRHARAVQHRTLQLTALTMLCVVLAVVVNMRFLLHFFLRKPLRDLTRGLETIASGAYDRKLPGVKWQDLDRIVKEVNRMASQIAARDRELRESKERFEELANSLPEIVYEADERGRFSFVNRSGLRSFGYEHRHLAEGLHIVDLFSPDERTRVEANMRRILTGEELGAHEYTAVRRDGTSFPVLVHSTPIVQGGRRVGFRGMAVDITERTRREEELRKLAEGVAHQVRNPMTTIGGFARRIRKRSAPHDESYQWADIILGETLRLEQMVADIHGYTSLPKSVPKLMLLWEVLSQVTEKHRKRLEGGGIHLSEHPPEVVPQVLADPALIAVALDRVIENAAQAMPTGGSLLVELATAENRLCASIQDTGVGISPDDLPYVFDPFFSTRPDATGLGLTAARRIVWENRGEIEIESKPGSGTRVRICLPVASTNEESNGPTKPNGQHH